MATELEQLTGVARRFMAFIIERYPFAWRDVMNSLTALQVRDVRETEEAIEAIRPAFGQELKRRLAEKSMIHGVPEPTPRTTASTRLRQAADELLDACDGFLRRAALEASLTAEERREILRGMILTRATDNKLKALFTSGDVRYANAAFQGKGFRSLGQEAIYAAAIRLRRGSEWQLPDGTWSGDVVAPLIRDLGAALAMRCERGDGPDGAERADGEGRPAARGKGPQHRRLRPGHPAADRTARHRDADDCRDGAGLSARGLGPRGDLVHRRRRRLARRVARGDQPVRRAAAAGDLLRAEQPDGAVDADRRSDRRAGVRRQGGRLRHPGNHARRHRSGCHRRGVYLGRGARSRRAQDRR